MPQSLTVLPNDGPVMRWAIEHGNKYLINLRDKHMFDDDISVFRYARDCGSSRSHSRVERCIRIDGFAGIISMVCGPDSHEFNIQLGSTAWISESLIKDNAYFKGPNKELTLSAKGTVPTSVLDSFIGKPIDGLIQLPGSLNSIITGRAVISAWPVDEDISANISTDPS